MRRAAWIAFVTLSAIATALGVVLDKCVAPS